EALPVDEEVRRRGGGRAEQRSHRFTLVPGSPRTSSAPPRFCLYVRATKRSRQVRSQRRQASAQTLQCSCMWACRSHSSPQLLQMARQASNSGLVTLGSYSVGRLRTLTV